MIMHALMAASKPLQTDWTQIWLAVITLVGALALPVVTFLLARVSQMTNKVDRKLDTVGVVLGETAHAVNSGSEATKAELKAANAKIDAMTAEILRISVGAATSAEQARPSAPPAAKEEDDDGGVTLDQGEGEPLVLPATVEITEKKK